MTKRDRSVIRKLTEEIRKLREAVEKQPLQQPFIAYPPIVVAPEVRPTLPWVGPWGGLTSDPVPGVSWGGATGVVPLTVGETVAPLTVGCCDSPVTVAFQ